MAVTIDDATANPVAVPSGTTASPFGKVALNDGGPALEVVSISLGAGPNTGGDLGSLSDPSGFGKFDSSTGIFAESAFSFGSPSAATSILNRLVYTPPTLDNVTYATVDAGCRPCR